MNYLEKLKQKANDAGNILCMGIDPVLEKIPGNTPDDITKFYFNILAGIKKEGIKIPSYKPNIAFFEQYGIEGLKSLKKIIKKINSMGSSVIMDAKRGDIGKTAKAYANSMFNYWDVDCVTISPYLGYDSIAPFMEFQGKGIYILNRTSNKSAPEIQNLIIDGKPMFKEVSKLIASNWFKEGVGAVVGATYLKELDEISQFFVNTGKQIPMLIPGVGAQGGSATDVMNILRNTNNPLEIHRVNSSSGISYAYLTKNSTDYVSCAITEIKKLIKELKI
jgi:orotidine-5'-phosphate decarboxylase